MSAGTGTVSGHRDFRRLWSGLAVSQLGSAVGMVALPVVAVVVVGASAVQVALLTAAAAATTALLAFPTGAAVEHRRKRPVMVAADVVRLLALVSIPVAAVVGSVTVTHLVVVAVLNAAGQLAFQAAAQAHLRSLVGPARLVDANGRLESTVWLSLTAGPSAGGVLVGLLGAVGTLLVDAASFLVSALAVRRIREPEPTPPPRTTTTSRRTELTAGLAFVWADPVLRRMLLSWVLFAGAVGMGSAVTVVFLLRDLGFTAWQFGLLMGLPSLGGFTGARLGRRLVARLGAVRALWWSSQLRAPGQLLVCLAVPGPVGLVLCGTGIAVTLFGSALANTTMSSYRQLHTPEHLMARVGTLWSFARTVAQPVAVLAGGLLVAVSSARVVLVVVTVLMLLASLLLPRTENPTSAGPSTVAPRAEPHAPGSTDR
ncbi:MFS transporter [Modestobacter sp. I12A-02628]|uniref:MFS transporter n=1 Tax=Goekera deserti TaxID=2497753 RepID=A0A7K3WBU0_9ACTN|nr:MFS transporter [Goekera deserti]MPQ98269.1 MFS transporter [Goekera deserti]NDI48095.1 MFS transporter [Goekera deserti]NEL53844.1 MFS transporter [Goekera deserti]